MIQIFTWKLTEKLLVLIYHINEKELKCLNENKLRETEIEAQFFVKWKKIKKLPQISKTK